MRKDYNDIASIVLSFKPSFGTNNFLKDLWIEYDASDTTIGRGIIK